MRQIEIRDDIYEQALKLAAERNQSVQSVIEDLLRERVVEKNPSAIIGLFADEPDMMDKVMEAVYELREKPMRVAHA